MSKKGKHGIFALVDIDTDTAQVTVFKSGVPYCKDALSTAKGFEIDYAVAYMLTFDEYRRYKALYWELRHKDKYDPWDLNSYCEDNLKIINAVALPRGDVFVIKCECGQIIIQQQYHYKVDCQCGKKANLTKLKGEWEEK